MTLLHLKHFIRRIAAKILLVRFDWAPPDQVRALARHDQGPDQGLGPEHRVRDRREGHLLEVARDLGIDAFRMA